MAKKIHLSTEIINNFKRIHPALDFFDDTAITSTKCQLRENYLDGDTPKSKFKDGFLSVMSNKDTFVFDVDELSKRKLYYAGKVDILKSRWEYEDVVEFCKDGNANSIFEIFQLIRNEFYYYLDINDVRIYDLLACFVLYTYFHPLFPYASIIHLWGNAGTGKTKTCSLLEAMCFNPVNSANISAATLYRIVEGSRATVLLDESEDLMGTDKGKEIINMLLAGIGRSGEVYRQEKGNNENFSTQSFRIFSPKVIANINGIELPSILTRVIRIVTMGSRDKTILNRSVEIESKQWAYIRNQLYRMTLTQFPVVKNTIGNLPEHKLGGRTFNIWEGILTLAYICSEDIYKSMLEYAVENEVIIKEDIDIQEDDVSDVKIELRQLCGDNLSIRITPDKLLSWLFPYYGQISKKDLHARMTRLGVKVGRSTIDGKTQRYYEIVKDKI